MKSDIFQEGRRSIPESDPNVNRTDFHKEDIGARKSHISGAHKKNDYTIRHIS